jgi:hypothetical protein
LSLSGLNSIAPGAGRVVGILLRAKIILLRREELIHSPDRDIILVALNIENEF